MNSWVQFVSENLETLISRNTRQSRSLVATFELVVEYDNGGLVQYLMNNSGDHIDDLEIAFEDAAFKEGVAWIKSVADYYGGPVPKVRDARIDHISNMPGFDDGDDPFELADAALAEIVPDIERLGMRLCDQMRT